MNPKISVIVPVYKAEKYLHRCVDSILAQTFTDFEVLLIDDGSPDRSGDICDEYAKKDSRVRVFHKENGGVSSARQCGIDNAQGEYTIHADPDDWVEPNMLEELYAKAKEDDADVVICDFYVNNADRQIYNKQEPSALDHETVLRELFQQLHGSCWNKFVRRDCYIKNKVQFELGLSFCEDLYFHACLLKNARTISYLSKAFYHYDQIINTNSIVARYKKTTFDYDKMLYDKFTELLIGTSAYSLAEVNMGYLAVYRAFHAKVYTSKEFKDRFYQFKNCVREKRRMKKIGFIYSSLLIYSCLGYYSLMRTIYRILIKIK